MNATDVVEQIKALPSAEKAKVIDWLLSDDAEFDAVFAAFDRLPRSRRLSEDDILALPRARTLRQ